MSDFSKKKCKPCESGTKPLEKPFVEESLKEIEGWEMEGGVISRTFQFRNYYETTSFVNAVIWIAHREDHHPDVSFGYKNCKIDYVTHAIGGISENDLICAAKINQLLQG